MFKGVLNVVNINFLKLVGIRGVLKSSNTKNQYLTTKELKFTHF